MCIYIYIYVYIHIYTYIYLLKKRCFARFFLAGVTGKNDAHLQLFFARNAGSGRWCTFGRTAGRAARPEWIYSHWQGVYFKLKTGGEVRIFGFYNNKQTKNIQR